MAYRVKTRTTQQDLLDHLVKPGYFTRDDADLYQALLSAREAGDYGLEGYSEGVTRRLVERTGQLLVKVTGMVKDA